jgi:hypothetical protein
MQHEADFKWTGFKSPRGDELPPSVVERISWYERQVRQQRIGFYASETLTILFSAAIPASAAAGASTLVTGILGAFVVVAAGLRQLFRWGENWVRSSASLVALQGAVVNWSYANAPYEDPARASAVLAAEVESIAIAETGNWMTMRRKALPQATDSTSAA